jgi:hypothetical protein
MMIINDTMSATDLKSWMQLMQHYIRIEDILVQIVDAQTLDIRLFWLQTYCKCWRAKIYNIRSYQP